MAVRLFDAHCHLQDPRIVQCVPQLIDSALRSGVVRFAVNGVSENDWPLVKQMGERYDCIIPCFGLHPWFIEERSPNWFTTLRGLFRDTPEAAIGEIGLDKGSHGKKMDFTTQHFFRFKFSDSNLNLPKSWRNQLQSTVFVPLVIFTK